MDEDELKKMSDRMVVLIHRINLLRSEINAISERLIKEMNTEDENEE